MYSNKSFKDKNSYIHKKNIEKNILILKKISSGKDFLDFGSGLNNSWENIANKHNFKYCGLRIITLLPNFENFGFKK